jgi:hypothetical protein
LAEFLAKSYKDKGTGLLAALALRAVLTDVQRCALSRVHRNDSGGEQLYVAAIASSQAVLKPYEL